MAKTSYAEKIEKKKIELEKARRQVVSAQTKAAKLAREIAELENFAVLGVARELNMPVSEMRSLLMELKQRHDAASGEGGQS